jgi:hypothetical protein
MSVSEKIRELAREGLSTAEIARRLGIRYQHAYGVLKGQDVVKERPNREVEHPIGASAVQKPSLTVDLLIAGGFMFAARWVLASTGDIRPDQPLPKAVGVYAFAKNGMVLYVGVATMGIAKRLYFYSKPGVTQRTSQRINTIIKNELLTVAAIDVYIALPPDFDWNGLPIHGSAGLELGLIKKYALQWNMRSAK